MNSEALIVWEKADEMAKLSQQYLRATGPCEDTSSEWCFDVSTERLRVKMLFPDLSELACDMLLNVRRSAFQQGIVARVIAGGGPAIAHHCDEQLEADIAAWREKIGLVCLPHLTPVQQEIVRARYLAAEP